MNKFQKKVNAEVKRRQKELDKEFDNKQEKTYLKNGGILYKYDAELYEWYFNNHRRYHIKKQVVKDLKAKH